MNSPVPDFRSAGDGRAQGFALVIALSLMALILLLLLTVSSMVKVSMQSAAVGKDVVQARQNALLGMQVALGRLQQEMGPDQRISATASLLDTNPGTESVDGVDQAQWLGAWEALEWDESDVAPTVDTDQGKPDSFRRWLVSLQDPDAVEVFASPLSFSAANDDAVVIVSGEGAVEPVYAERVEVELDTDEFSTGHFGWWIGDENTKAALVYAGDALEDEDDLADLVARSYASSWNSVEVVPEFANVDSQRIAEHEGYGRDGIEFVLREDSSSTSPWTAEFFHDFTQYSQGLLTDVRGGGLRLDLTSLFEAPGGLPSGYADTELYEDGPVWEVLRRHYLRYQDVEFATDGTPYIDARTSQSDGSDLWETTDERDYILPIPCRVQYLFSIAVDPWDIYTTQGGLTATADPSAPAPGTDIYYLVMKPVVVLWNPFNVEMQWSMPNKRSIFYLAMGTPPVEVSFDGGSSYRSLDTMFWDLSQSLFVAEMLPGDDLVLAPGETVVLSLTDKSDQYQRMLIPSGLYSDNSDGTYGIYESVGLNSRNNNIQSGWDENVVGFHTPLLRNESATDAVDQFIPASESIQVRIRFKANESSSSNELVRFATHINVGSESNPGVSQMGRLATIEFRENSPGNSTFLQDEYDLGNLQGAGLLSIDNSGSENSFLFSVSAEKKVFGDLESGGKLGYFLDPRIPYYYTTDFSSGENTLAPIEFQFRDKLGGEPLFQFDSSNGKGYFGSLIEGIYGITANEIPVAPMQSILQLRHAPLGWDYGHAIFRQTAWSGQSSFASGESGDEFAAVYNQPVGNAYSHPLMPVNSIRNPSRSRSVDHSYYLNHILADGYFFSGLAPREAGALYDDSMTPREVFDSWVAGDVELAGGRYEYSNPEGIDVSTIAAELFASDGSVSDECFEKIAAYIAVKGLFNVNSTSVNAWTALLGGLRDVEVARYQDSSVPVLSAEDVSGTPVGRRGILSGENVADAADSFDEGVRFWSGFRSLSDDQIRDLAGEIVTEVKRRGPFRSLGEFLNREVSNRSDYNGMGAVQAAIEASGINSGGIALSQQINRTELTASDVSGFGFPNNTAFVGGSGEGTNGAITQADLLTPVAPILSARGDTFVIRGYGDSGSSGAGSAKVYCEAIYTRTTAFVGTTNLDPSETPLPGTLEDQFGRKFALTSFKWMEPSEI